MVIGYKAWRSQNYLLNRMTLRELVRAYFTYPAIQAYLILCAVSAGLAVYWMESLLTVLGSVAAAVLVYPLVWYLLHRFVLHGRWMYRSRWTARLWKRVHYDHHLHPNDLSVLFGALHNTLITIFVATAPVGWLIGGAAGAAAAFAAGLATTCFYEFCHCIQHLAYTPKLKVLQRMKKLHLAHHFHNEQGNYGITNFVWDRLLSTYYERPREMPRSPTVRNLGYTGEEVGRYPWVARISDGQPSSGLATGAQRTP